MGELCEAWRRDARDDRTCRRRSTPSCLDRADVDRSSKVEWSCTSATTKTSRTRWSIGGSCVSGRGVPAAVRATRYDVADGCVEDRRKRSRKYTSESPAVPPKRFSHVRENEAASSAWNCAGLTWGGLRRRLSVFRCSTGTARPGRDAQPRVDAGMKSAFACRSQIYVFCRTPSTLLDSYMGNSVANLVDASVRIMMSLGRTVELFAAHN